MVVAILLIAVIIAALVGIALKIKGSGLPDAVEEVCFLSLEHVFIHSIHRCSLLFKHPVAFIHD